MSAVSRATSRTFSALKVRNFKLYFFGQGVSVSGTWMQSVAQGWLVLDLTGSGTLLGITVALQFLPMLLVGPWGGLVVDRSNKRTVLFVTQTAGGLLALTLAILTSLGEAKVGVVMAMAFGLGIVNLFDNPARQSFVQEMVGRELLPNAVSLNSVLINGGRVVGPSVAGLVIEAAGLATCFYINAASYLAVILALGLMRSAELRPIKTATRRKGQVLAGLRYAFDDDKIRDVLIVIGVVGVFAFNFTTVLPLLVKYSFHLSAGSYGILMASMGLGAVLGGLTVAHRARPSFPLLTGLCTAFALAMVGVALSPTFLVAVVLVAPMGAVSIAFVSTSNAMLQLLSREEMRGRVMSLYAIGFLGSTPIGAPLMGIIATTTSPRVSLAVGAAATTGAAVLLAFASRRHAGGQPVSTALSGA
jgi:MFS family permease